MDDQANTTRHISGLMTLSDVLEFLAESDDWQTGNHLLELILFAASAFYNRHDDDASCRALGLAHGIIEINIDGPDDETVKDVFADMAVVASFLFEWIQGADKRLIVAKQQSDWPPPLHIVSTTVEPEAKGDRP